MAVNLPPHYHDADARYKKAKSAEDKLVALREMWVLLPKHKASEKVQVILKCKISELTDEIDQAKSGPKKAAPGSFKFTKQGAGSWCSSGRRTRENRRCCRSSRRHRRPSPLIHSRRGSRSPA